VPESINNDSEDFKEGRLPEYDPVYQGYLEFFIFVGFVVHVANGWIVHYLSEQDKRPAVY